jgi:multidrug efflux pump
LIAIFVPIVFLKGDIGRLFSEFAITMAAAVGFSALIALTLSPMLASKVLVKSNDRNKFLEKINHGMGRLRLRYKRGIRWCLGRVKALIVLFVVLLLGAFFLAQQIPSEYAPPEDRGNFMVMVNGPEGASYAYMEEYMTEIENRLMKYVHDEEITRMMVRAPRSFGTTESFNSGMVIVVMNDWSLRRNSFEVMDDIRSDLNDLPGVTTAVVMRQGFGSQAQKPVQFVLGGGTYEELAGWRDILLAKLEQNNPGLIGIDWDYKETKPQVEVIIDTNRAADLGVSVNNIGRTLEAMLGSRALQLILMTGRSTTLSCKVNAMNNVPPPVCKICMCVLSAVVS